MSKHQTLPVLPLRTAVLFPGQAIPVVVGRPGTVKAVEAALKGEGRVLAVTQREDSEDAQPDNLYTMGVVASLGPIKRGLNGMQLVLKGDDRATTLNYRTREDHLVAATLVVEELPPLDSEDPAFVGLYRETRERAMELGQLRGVPDEVLKQVLDSITEPGPFIDQIAGYLELPVSDKQLLLETLGVEERMRKVLVHLQRHIGMFKAQAQIQSQVQEELGERQREMYLREQLKAIQKELGEGDESERELQQLRERLQSLVLPPEARAEVNRELARLERAGPQSMDAQVVRTYLEWVAELPWNEHSDDNLDLQGATTILDEDHHGLQDVKDRILEFLAVRQLRAKQVAEEADRTAHSEGAAAAHEAAAAAAGVSPDAVTTEPGDSASVERAADAAEAGDERKAKARAMAKGPILLFVGPPGVGKTSIAKSIARSLDRKYVRMALGGARDEADIRGHRRTYVGAMPGRIVQGMKQAGTKNPVFLLDEVDKLGVSFQGDPASALLEVLDPAQNDSFTDHYLNVPFDLSEVLFIATANFLQNIPGPLLDRMEVVEFSGYTEREKIEIAKKYLIPRQLEENGLAGKNIRFTDGAVQAVVSQYTRESGVRQLEREIGKVARKIARKIASGDQQYTEVTEEAVRELLGRPKVRPERAAEENLVGVGTGMYYTPAGGDIMFVEASMRELQSAPATDDGGSRERVGLGNVALILTGQLGEVMKESARAALTYATNHAQALGIPSRLGPVEVHIHVPAGAIPKDGPSAGVTMATALASAMSGRPMRRDVAMTGEITLRGRVLPIGGVKEKVLGAHRAGIKQVILPADNEADLEDIPEEVRSTLQFHIVHTLDEVLEIALMPVPAPTTSRPVSERGDDFVV